MATGDAADFPFKPYGIPHWPKATCEGIIHNADNTNADEDGVVDLLNSMSR